MLPRYIAICGNPKSGKSTAAEILTGLYDGYTIVDDGEPLRDIAVRHFGCSFPQVRTQAGKLEKIDVLGEMLTVRAVLGRIGLALENEFGEDIIPEMARIACEKKQAAGFIIPSCRRNQGLYWKRHGGLVIEIVNPQAPPSGYAFDLYNTEAVDIRIMNDALSVGLSGDDALQNLAMKLAGRIDAWADAQSAAQAAE